jgi:hypothetical protein
MTAQPPTLTQQIEAVAAAARRYVTMAEQSIERGDELEAIATALEAAAETLKTMEFMRETLK